MIDLIDLSTCKTRPSPPSKPPSASTYPHSDPFCSPQTLPRCILPSHHGPLRIHKHIGRGEKKLQQNKSSSPGLRPMTGHHRCNLHLPTTHKRTDARAMNTESPEQLLATFKNAALSVTKLYKTAVAVQSKTRGDGYQDCLDDLLVYLDKERVGLSDGEGWLIRRWATERLEARDSGSQGMESEDEPDRPESDKTEAIMSSPATSRPSADALMREMATTQVATVPSQASPEQPAAIIPPAATGAAAAAAVAAAAAATPRTTATEHHEITVPSLDTFTFQSPHPFPHQDAHLNIANLHLSDSHHHARQSSSATLSSSRGQKSRVNGRSGSRAGTLGRGAGSKRKVVNLAELWDLGDVFGGGGKRSRHA